MKKGAVAGGAVWTALAVAWGLHLARLTTIELLFLLAPLVTVPLGLGLVPRLASRLSSGRAWRILQRMQFPAALLALAGLWFRPGKAAATLTLPWLAFGCMAAGIGLLAVARRDCKSVKSACVLASLLYLPVGCAWLVASRLGLTPMHFQEPIVLLTAVHFHFAGFAAPLLAAAVLQGAARTARPWKAVFQIVTCGVIAGPGMLAAGFVIGPRLKLAGALVVACSEASLALSFFAMIATVRPHAARMFLGVSAASVLFAMILAAIWAIGEFPLQPFVHLDEMARFHGVANAFGFTLCGLLGWTLAVQEPKPA